jgi:hypothetical protein
MWFADVPSVRIWFNPPLLRVLLFAACLGIGTTHSAGQERVPGTKSLPFDIPAQALREGLFAYTDVTGLSILVDDGLTAGRRSAPVRGRFVPEDALKILLTGTGLQSQYTADNAFTLVPATDTAPGGLPPRDESHDETYFRAVQTAVKSALCSRAQTLPGQYRVVVQLWIGESGVVSRAAFVGSTGSRDRDQTLAEMLNGLPVGTAPPAGLPQPVTLVILPRLPNVTNDCAPLDEKAAAKRGG